MLPSVRNAAKQLLCRAAFPTAEPVQTSCALTPLRDLLQPLSRSTSQPQLYAYTSGSAQIRAFSSASVPHTAGLRNGGLEQPSQSSGGILPACRGNVSSAETPRTADSMHQGMPGSSLRFSSAAAAPAVAKEAAAAEESSSAVAAVPAGRVQNTPPPPWTPTQQLKKRNFLPRRMGHLIQVRSIGHTPMYCEATCYESSSCCAWTR